MKNRKGFLMIVLVLSFAGYVGYNYLYNENKNSTSETIHLEISAPYLVERLQTNDATSLLNKTITVTGIASEITQNTIQLSSSVQCSFETSPIPPKIGTSLRIKGRCIGYDDVLKVVRMEECSIVE